MSPDLVGEYTRRRDAVAGRAYSPLAMELLDPEYAADRLLEELGPAACQRLAVALVAKVREVTTP